MRALLAVLLGLPVPAAAQDARKGYDVRATGLKPAYPEDFSCSPLTSLYASWKDVDGTRRPERHSGVDGGRLGDAVLSPAGGVIEAAWKANWGWGDEGALLIRHSRKDLNLPGDGPFYFSEFDHLDYDEIKHFEAGQVVRRGQKLATVTRPGGKRRYLPEVHWEVWEATDTNDIRWKKNRYGRQVWRSHTARLLDPLYLLSLNSASMGKKVQITPFVKNLDYSHYAGFTYILPCSRLDASG